MTCASPAKGKSSQDKKKPPFQLWERTVLIFHAPVRSILPTAFEEEREGGRCSKRSGTIFRKAYAAFLKSSVVTAIRFEIGWNMSLTSLTNASVFFEVWATAMSKLLRAYSPCSLTKSVGDLTAVTSLTAAWHFFEILLGIFDVGLAHVLSALCNDLASFDHRFDICFVEFDSVSGNLLAFFSRFSSLFADVGEKFGGLFSGSFNSISHFGYSLSNRGGFNRHDFRYQRLDLFGHDWGRLCSGSDLYRYRCGLFSFDLCGNGSSYSRRSFRCRRLCGFRRCGGSCLAGHIEHHFCCVALHNNNSGRLVNEKCCSAQK